MAHVEIIQLTKQDGTKFYPAISQAQGGGEWGQEPETGTEVDLTVDNITKRLLKTDALAYQDKKVEIYEEDELISEMLSLFPLT